MPISRREFATVIAGGIASEIAAQAQDAPERKVGYCIIGLGRISTGEFMPGILKTQRCRITALVSGHRDKAERFAKDYGVPATSIYSYEDFDRRMASNPDVDAVYVALPNSMHAEYTVRSARAGKHVLCEKPMAVSVGECEQMIEACKSARKKLMIAYRLQYEPNTLKAQQLIRNRGVGALELIDSSFGFNVGHNEWRTDRKLSGGGPLMDVGIYCLQACRLMSGEEPVEVDGRQSVIDHDGRFETVEENLVWTMRFPSGLLATCNTSFGTNTGGWFRVYGSKGSVAMEPAFSYDGLKLHVQSEHEPSEQTAEDHNPMQFAREGDHLAECILSGGTPKSPGEEGLRDIRILEAVYQSCRERRPIHLTTG